MNTEAIKELQHYLRTLSFRNPRIKQIVIDGKYGHDTALAISAFQETVELPITGNTDPDTWAKLVDSYQNEITTPTPLQVFDSKDSVINTSSAQDVVTILQTLLYVIDPTNQHFKLPNGRYDTQTQHAVQSFQQQQNLTPTGTVDVHTWNTLVMQYNTRRFLQERI